MPNKLYEENDIRDIAIAIREKNGTENTYNVSEMGDAIRAITGGGNGIVPSGDIIITENGTFDVTNFAQAIINVSGSATCGYTHGQFTLDEDFSPIVNDYYNKPYNIPHNMATKPTHFVITIGEGIDEPTANVMTMGAYHELVSACFKWNLQSGQISTALIKDSIDIDDTNIIIKPSSSGCTFPANVTYHWVAW